MSSIGKKVKAIESWRYIYNIFRAFKSKESFAHFISTSFHEVCKTETEPPHPSGQAPQREQEVALTTSRGVSMCLLHRQKVALVAVATPATGHTIFYYL